MRRLLYIVRALMRGLAYSICLGITLFIISSSYETASGNDVPFLSAVQRVDLQIIDPSLRSQSFADLTSPQREGNFGRPETMRIVVNKTPQKLVVGPGLRREGHWLARANTSHVLYASEAKAGNIGDMVVYMNQGWRTIADPLSITEGNNIFIDTNQHWRYMFRVQEVQSVDHDARTLIPQSKDTRLIIIINEPNGAHSTVVWAQFVSLLNTGQI